MKPNFTGVSTAGRAEDLGETYFRSMWERNFARFLKYTGEAFAYEPKTFWFDGVRRGTNSYKPDFQSLKTPRLWYEVKGYMNARSRVALQRMKKYYPGETIVIIEREWFRAAKRQGLDKLIPHWETQAKARALARMKDARPTPPLGNTPRKISFE